MRLRLVFGLSALAAAVVMTPAAGAEAEPRFEPELFEKLEARLVGPYRGGRVTAVTGVHGDLKTFYMGSTGGGVWKTEDGGVSWKNVTDGQLGVGSIGAVAVAPSDSNVVWAGTGSACPRGNVSPGDGVYRSTDAGQSWQHAGLREAGQIGRIRVHPTDPDRAWVAALGHIFGPNDERGVFRTTDGGRSWQKVLFVSDRAGAVDLALDPVNPRVLYAATWRVERKPWTLTSGGEGSSLWRSTDGGDSWERLTDGLPQGELGRIGVAVSPARPQRVWALIEAEEGGLYRSDNGGKSFRRVNAEREFRQRAWYYTHVFADPRDAETVWVLNVGLWRSHDGGKSFEYLRAPHGDHHDLWIHPDDPQVVINGNDGGANVSYNGGATWSAQDNQPTAEMYRLTVDGQFPYRLYGCQQDNSCVSIPSRTAARGIARHHWWVIGGCESGHVAVDPRNPDVTYAGCYGGQLGRHDRRTDQEREIMVYPQLAVGQAAADLRYRFQWNAPLRISPHDPNVLYHASQYVHRSTDEGQSWQAISPDLSRKDPAKQEYAGGPITLDNTGVEVYGTVFAFEESPREAGVLWAGSDDGLVHLSRDGGTTWQDVTPKQMPEWAQVNAIELSPHGPGRALLAVTRYRLDDFRPYVFRTDDYGARWQLLTDGANGIPAGHFVRVVREDPGRKGLLFAGTEFGLYVSFDDGVRWQPLELGLPATPITDLAIAEGDLVIATQGRSFWIFDDLSPLRQLDDATAAAAVHLFQPRDAHRFGGGGFFGGSEPSGKNPPVGVVLQYLLGEEAAARAAEGQLEVSIEILGGAGEVLRSFSSLREERRAPSPWERFLPPDALPVRKLPAERGVNRFVWDLRLADADLVDGTVLWGSARGPVVPPGTYEVAFTAGDYSRRHRVEVRADPRLATSPADYEAQYALAREIWASLSASHRALRRLRDVRQQVEALTGRLAERGAGDGAGNDGSQAVGGGPSAAAADADPVRAAAAAVTARLDAIEDALHQNRSESSQDVLNFPPRLDNQLLALLGVVGAAEAPPTDGTRRRYADLEAELDAQLAALDAVFATELDAFNQAVRATDAQPVIVPSGEPPTG